jgi:hypothetical protein
MWAAATVDGSVAILAGVSLAAAGTGAVFVVASATALGQVSVSEGGLASGIVSTFHEFGAALGAAVVSSLVLRHAEAVIGQGGRSTAWLAVMAGNARARRFYARLGWRDRAPSPTRRRRRPARSQSPPTETSARWAADENPPSPPWADRRSIVKGAS